MSCNLCGLQVCPWPGDASKHYADRLGTSGTVKLNVPHVVIEELPTWCGGVLYNGTDDVLTLRARVPASEYGDPHLLHLEMTPEQARALVDALGQCLSRAEAAAKVLDVTEETSD